MRFGPARFLRSEDCGEREKTIYIYIYIYEGRGRERERERLYIYIYMYIFMIRLLSTAMHNTACQSPCQ